MVYVQKVLVRMRVCVIIPACNERKIIGKLVSDICRQGEDVLVIDDGSYDETARAAHSAGATVIFHKLNKGKGRSLRKGFEDVLKKDYDAIITMDGDGQHLTEDIPRFIKTAENSDAGIILGNRMGKSNNMPVIRKLTNSFMSWLISKLSHQYIPDSQCGFRLIKRKVLDDINLNTSKFEIESEILLKATRKGYKVKSIPIKTIYKGQTSKINPLIDTIRFIRFILR